MTFENVTNLDSMKIRDIFSETKKSTEKAVQLCDRSVAFLVSRIGLEGTESIFAVVPDSC